MPDLDRYLYERLRAQAASVDLPYGDVRGVMARGRRRRRRAGAVVVTATVAAAGTVTGVLVSEAGAGKPAQVAAGSESSTPTATGTQLSWQVLPAGSGLSGLASLADSGSAAYAVSTSPGVTADGSDVTNQLYRTADGLSWTTATGPSGLSTAGVAVSGDRVYTVGTGPATAATGATGAYTTAVSWSDDGGGSWQDSALPVDLNAPAGAVTVGGENVDLAAGPKGVLASVTLDATADLAKLVPGASPKALWTATTNGIEVLGAQVNSTCGLNAVLKGSSVSGSSVASARAGALAKQAAAGYAAKQGGTNSTFRATPQSPAGKIWVSSGLTGGSPTGQIESSVPCAGSDGQITGNVPADQAYKVTATYTWSQLGVGSQLADALQGDALVFYSNDGSSFKAVTLPAGTTASVLAATPHGFAMLASEGDQPTSEVLQSADGSLWTPSTFALPAAAAGAYNLGYVGGHLLVLGQNADGTTTAFDLLAGGWKAVSLPLSALQVSFGSMGVGVTGTGGSGDANSWQVAFSPDGLTWSTASLVRLAGEPIQDANVVVGSDQVVVTVTEQPAHPTPGAKVPQVQLVGTSSS